MKQSWPLLTRCTAELVTLPGTEEEQAKQNFLADVQRFSSKKLEAADIHVRGMRIVNSKASSFYGRFTPDALEEVAALMPGRPLMVGHDYSTLPVGRFFAARKIFAPETAKTPRKDSYWVEALFYLPADDEGSAIARRIDMGVYAENSLGWLFNEATCSICKNDVRDIEACRHMPGEVYEAGLCTFDMQGIVDVLEGSIVFAGAERGTHFFSASSVAAPSGEPDAGAAMVADLASWKAAQIKATSAQDAPPEDLLAEFMVARVPKADPNQPMRGAVQALACSQDRFEGPTQASRWVRDHHFRADRVEQVGDGWLFKQVAEISSESRRIALDEGVAAVLARQSV